MDSQGFEPKRSPAASHAPCEPSADSDLPALLAAYDEALKAGSSQFLTDSLPEVLPRDQKAELQRAQVCLQLLENVFPRSACSVGDRATRQPAGLGRFQIQRELGRGGFGIVYLARDPKLERDVALKVPHPQLLGHPEAWSRFQREAQAAAGLAHPHIVSVYEAGEADQTYYIALAYCPGVSLADWLRRQTKPVAARDAAHLVATLARATHYAHTRGVVHLDLKPANVLLAEVGGQGSEVGDGNGSTSITLRSPTPDLGSLTPRITDFGLAKNLEGGATQTQSKTMAGTPNYMAPEQAGAKVSVGPATDVYALGAILYEMLTGRAPFQGHSALETLHQVRFVDAIAPSRLRSNLNRDLETICVKCLEKNPVKRYASANALADDLERWLEGQPIVARRVGSVERGYRWCRRKPLVAGLLASLAVALLLGFAGVFWQWKRAERNADDTKRESNKYRDEWARAERHLTKARELMDTMTKLAADIDRQPGFGKTAIAVFEEALVFQLEVLAEKQNDPAVRLETAKASYQVANNYYNLREWDKALAAFDRSLDLLAKLTGEFPQTDEYRFELGLVQTRLGHVLRVGEKLPESLKAYDTAIEILDELVTKNPKNGTWLTILSEALHNSALLHHTREQVEERDRRTLRGASLKEQALALDPDNPHYKRSLAFGVGGIASIHMRNKRIDEAEAEYRRALKLHMEADAKEGNRHQVRYTGDMHRLLAELLVKHGQPQRAVPEFDAALRIFKQLVADFPFYAIFRRDLAETLVAASKALPPDQAPRAKNMLDQAAIHYDRLSSDFSPEPRSLRSQTAFFAARGKEMLSKKDTAGAQTAYAKAITAGERLLTQSTTYPSDRNALVLAFAGMFDSCETMKDWPKAEEIARKARDWLRPWAEESPKNVGRAKDLATWGDKLSRSLEGQRRVNDAADSCAIAAALWQKVMNLQNSAAHGNARADTLLQQARLLRTLDKDAEAASALRDACQSGPKHAKALNALAWLLTTSPDKNLHSAAEALDFAQRAVKEAPKDPNLRHTLGVAYYRVGDHVFAIAAIDDAIRIRKRASAEDWFFQAMARWRLGDEDAARRDYQNAIEWMEKRAPNDAELRRFRAEAEQLMAGDTHKDKGP